MATVFRAHGKYQVGGRSNPAAHNVYVYDRVLGITTLISDPYPDPHPYSHYLLIPVPAHNLPDLHLPSCHLPLHVWLLPQLCQEYVGVGDALARVGE